MPDTPITEVALMNKETKEVFADTIRIFFMDLLAFNKTEEECETNLDLWIYSIKNSSKKTTAPQMASKSPVFGRLYSMAELAAMPTRKRNQYELSLKHYRDLVSDKETTRNRVKRERDEGLAEGLAKGHAEGRMEEKIVIAKNLLAMNMSIEQISSITGLSDEDIVNIQGES